MFGKLLLLTLRNLRRKRLYTAIVIGGLSLGIVTFLAIIQWSAWHLSFDSETPQSRNIYRLTLSEKRENFERHTARIIHGDVVYQLHNNAEIPDILSIARLAPFRNAIVRKDEIVFYENKSYACDKEFIELFKPQMVIGEALKSFEEPNKLILSEHTARKYFGEENPVGQSLEIVHQFGYKGEEYEITGVFKSFPENTHFKIDLLTSFSNPGEYKGTAWVYIKTTEEAIPGKIEKQVKQLIEENNDVEYSKGLTPSLMPLRDIHLKSHLARELENNLQLQALIIILLAGIMVFMLAWFNFTLLTISQNQLNLKKLIYQWQMGAGKKTFFYQFFIEFLCVGIISFLFAIGLAFLISTPLKNTFSVSLTEDSLLLILSLALILFVLIISALLTALFATQRLYRILKFRYFSSKSYSSRTMNSKTWFIRTVIIIEFVITYILITNLYIIDSQVKYSIKQQIGSNDSSTIQLTDLPRAVIDKYPLFKEQLQKFPVFKEITAMMEEPGGAAMDAFSYSIEGLPDSKNRLFVFPVDEDFLRFYDLKILNGTDFPSIYNTEDTTEYFILNETAAKLFQIDSYEDLLGRELKLDFESEGFIYPGNITGVIEDFHLSSMVNEVNPMVIFPEYTWLYCISIRINGDTKQAIQVLRREWVTLFPEYPLQYTFTNDLYKDIYSSQLTELKILFVFSIISLLIAGTGLFALSSFFMQQKSHAASIRKINGARMMHILLPEILQYLYLASISTIIALPVTWFTMNKWLSNFSYRITIPLWIFPSIFLFLLFFSWISVLYHTIKLARQNPIDFIRNE